MALNWQNGNEQYEYNNEICIFRIKKKPPNKLKLEKKNGSEFRVKTI